MGGARTLLHGARMPLRAAVRPVTIPRPSPNRQTDARPKASVWPEGSRESAEQLHRLLSIEPRQWHALKGVRQRRAAEQLASALVQLLNGGDATPMVEQGLGWLRGELRDPGCPSHGR